MPNIDGDKAELEKYIDEISRLHTQPPDPTSLLLLKGHALVDDWLERYIRLANSSKPVPLNHRYLQPLNEGLTHFFSSPRPQIQISDGFISKLRDIESLKMLPTYLEEALEQMNKVRNDYAHDFNTRVGRSQIDSILNSLIEVQGWKDLYEKRRASFKGNQDLLGFVFEIIITELLMRHTAITRLNKELFQK